MTPSLLERLGRISIRHKLLGLFLIFLLLTVNLFFLLVYHQHNTLLREQLAESMRSQAHLIAINSEAAIAFLDQREASRLLNSLGSQPNILAARSRVNGNTVAEYQKTPAAPSVFPAFTVDTLFQDDLLFVRQAIPGDNTSAHIELIVSLQQFRDTLGEVMWESGLLLFVALLIAAFLSRLILAGITAPIEHLNGIMNRVAQNGRFDERVSLRTGDEIGNLGQCFNQMLDTLHKRDEELHHYRENLEHMVDERTAALHVAIEEAREASRAKSDFLARMSHEIRTPMNAILGFSRMVQETPLNPQQKEHIEQVMHSSETLLGIINDILDFSKIEAGRMTLEHLPFDPAAVLRSAQTLLSSKAREKQLPLILRCASDIPPLLEGDALRLSQILINLIANAIKFTDQGEVEISAQLLAHEGATARLKFAVRDTGIGIPEHQRAHLFSPFSQADNSITRRYGGTGLGLVICRQLVNLMGGEIQLESSPGSGSTFTFALTFPVLDKSQSALPSAPPPAQEKFPHWQGERILLVEDIAINRTIAIALLKKVGLTVDIATNGQEALDKLAAQDFDLVLMDIQMPVMDGLTATRHLREQPRHAELPILALSAHALAEDRKMSLDAGMNEHLVKPIVPRDLYAALSRWILPADPIASAGMTQRPQDEATPPHPEHVVQAPQLPCFPGLNTALGLKLHMDKPALYLKTLHDFRQDFASTVETLRHALADEDRDTARRLAHSTKSVAGMLGAQGLQQVASQLEATLANPASSQDQRALHLEIYARTLTDLLGSLAQLPAQPLCAQCSQPQDCPSPSVLIELLESSLRQADARSNQRLQQLREQLARLDPPLPNAQTLLDRLETLIDDVEYDAALPVLGQLEHLLEAHSA